MIKSCSRLVTVSKHRREKRPKHRPARKPTSAHDRQNTPAEAGARTLSSLAKRVSSSCSLGRHSDGKEIPSRARPRPTPPSTFLFLPTLFSFQRSRRTKPPSVDPETNLAKHPTDTSKLLTPEGAKTSRPAHPLKIPGNQTVSLMRNKRAFQAGPSAATAPQRRRR